MPLDLHPADLSPVHQPDGESSYIKAERLLDLAEQRGLYRFDWLHQRRDGSLLPAEITLLAIAWQGGPALLCLWRDMTDRERDRELLENMQEAADIGGWDLDLATNMVWWTKQVYRIHELPPGGPMPLDRGLSFYAPEARPVLEEALRQAIEQGTPWDLEMPFVTARGRPLWVRAIGRAGRQDGRGVRLFGSFQDVTERHTAEAARATSQRRLQIVMDHARVMIAWMDRNYCYRFVNRHYADFFAMTSEVMAGKSAREVLGETAFAQAQSRMDEVLAGRSMEYELELTGYPGGTRLLLVSYAPEFEGDRVIGFVSVKKDITERKRAEQLAASRTQVLERIAQGAPLKTILETIARRVELANPAVSCSLLLLDAESRRLHTAAAPSLPEFYNRAIDGLEIGPHVGSCGAAAYSGQRVIVEDIATHPNWEPFRALAAEAGLTACWSEPIRSADSQVLGTFALYPREARPPGTHEIRTLEEAAQLAAIAIDRARDIESLRLSEARYRLLTEHVTDVIFTMDQGGRLTYLNPAVQELLGYTSAEALTLPPAAIMTPEEAAALLREARGIAAAALSGADPPHYHGEFELARKEGSKVWTEVTLTPLPALPGQTNEVLGVIRNITERKRAEALLWRQANHDSLTGLPNRQLFLDRLEQQLGQAQRAGHQLALLFIDLDRFKDVNDSLGHTVGDELLIEVARRLRDCVRQIDTVARVGGDEFTIIMADMQNTRRVEAVARKIIDALARRFTVRGESFQLTASIGIALYPLHAAGLTELIQHADQAMYAAKGWRNQYRYFTPALRTAAQARQQLAAELREALRQQQFEVHYQPIVDLPSGRIGKAEALVRWRHPGRGLLAADAFLPALEADGQIKWLGEWIFREAAQWVRERQGRQEGGFQVCMSKSSPEFAAVPSWLACLESLGLPGGAIVLEVSEDLLLASQTEVLEPLRRCRKAGMGLAIDDYGAGHAALACLRQSQPDFLKIDSGLIRDLLAHPESRALCGAIIVMAHKMGIQVIAEGVETPAQRDWLRDAGGDCAQGSLFAQPLPAAAIDW